MEDCFTFRTPSGCVKLEGVDDLIAVTYLADESSLTAEITLKDMSAGKLHSRLKKRFKHPISDLFKVPQAVCVSTVQKVVALIQTGAQFLHCSTATCHQIFPEEAQFLTVTFNVAHGLCVLVQTLI